MGCSSCSNGDGTPNGCKSNGSCSTGGCNRMNTYDWMSNQGVQDSFTEQLVEVSFKNGVHKDFFQNDLNLPLESGMMVAVEADKGYDIGRVNLCGTLVELQMKKKKYRNRGGLGKILRRAHAKDLERLEESRSLERDTLIRTRAIIQSLNLEMKLGEVEYQGDGRKCTFYYTAEGRVDFRELVRVLAREFRVKVEMRQIGARQEAGIIGGIGSCGRELCCSTWLSDFKSVSTSAARYQNLAINLAKLSGQCGRLKCCLNYELDTYMDALEEFPTKADRLYLQSGYAQLVKTDIFRKIMYYSVPGPGGRNLIQAIPLSRVNEVLELNKKGEKPEVLLTSEIQRQISKVEEEVQFADVTGEIDLPNVKRRNKRRNNRRRGNNKNRGAKQGASNSSSSGKQNSSDRRSGGKKESNKASAKSGSSQKGGNQKGNSQRGNNKGRKNQRRRPQNKNKSNQNQGNKQNKGGNNQRKSDSTPKDKQSDA